MNVNDLSGVGTMIDTFYMIAFYAVLFGGTGAGISLVIAEIRREIIETRAHNGRKDHAAYAVRKYSGTYGFAPQGVSLVKSTDDTGTRPAWLYEGPNGIYGAYLAAKGF